MNDDVESGGDMIRSWLDDLEGNHERFVLGTDAIFPRDRDTR